LATKRLLLINNAPLTNRKGDLIFEVTDQGNRQYLTRHEDEDYSELVMDTFNAVMERDAANELSQVVENVTENYTSFNDNFRIKMVSTPVYNLQKQLSMTSTGAMRIPGVNLDLTGIWENQRIKFLTGEFFKYIRLVPYLENAMNKSLNRPSNPSLAARRGDKTVMHLVYAKIDNLYNPYDAFRFLQDTALFKKAYSDELSEEAMSLSRADIFKTIVVKDSTEVLMGTSCDVLNLCGITHKAMISTMDLHRLMAGICLKLIGAGDSPEVTTESLYFPVGRRFYEVFDVVDNDRVIDRYFDVMQANRRADEDDLIVRTVDTDVNFSESVFGSTRAELVDAVRGADFV
jgi:hypothetical protein